VPDLKSFTFQIQEQIVDYAKKHFPQLEENLPPVDIGKIEQFLRTPFRFNVTKTKEDLGINLDIGLEKMCVDTIRTILDLKEKFETAQAS
jgi:hypothetical protein